MTPSQSASGLLRAMPTKISAGSTMIAIGAPYSTSETGVLEQLDTGEAGRGRRRRRRWRAVIQ